MKFRAAILANIYQRNQVHRDSSGVPGLMSEGFIMRFGMETMPEMFFSGMKAEWKAHEELLSVYDQPSNAERLKIHRESLEETQQEIVAARTSAPAGSEAPGERGMPEPTAPPDPRPSGC